MGKPPAKFGQSSSYTWDVRSVSGIPSRPDEALAPRRRPRGPHRRPAAHDDGDTVATPTGRPRNAMGSDVGS